MITISVLGETEVRVDGRTVTTLSTKQRQILAILALADGAPVTRDRLADDLWEGNPPSSYVGTLDSYVCVLRRALGLAAGRTSALATTGAGFVLEHGAGVEVDLHWFRRLARAAGANRGLPALDWAEEAIDLVRGDLLAEFPYAAWADRAREDFVRSYVELCTSAAQRANGLGEFPRAVRLARAAVERDPLAEDAWYQLMLAHWFGGSRARALSAYAELRAGLAEAVGDDPGPRCQQLYSTILQASAEAPPAPVVAEERVPRLRTILTLLRQELETTPGVRAPALDAQLSEVAVRALAEVS
jgi:DNA-binding SARP family transcriptional activator